MTTPGISIIVPFYNDAAVARRCIESLLNQTLPAAELVLVDDGSTDGTPELLDSLADGSRIRVFHQANEGVSGARNHGVAQCRSEFVSFVDGDDVVSPFYVEALTVALSGMLAAGSEMPYGVADGVVLREGRVKEFDFPSLQGAGGLRVLSREDSVCALCRGELSCTAWAKVAPRELYERVPFPVGKVYEDWYVLGQHVIESDCIVHIPLAVYGHVMRTGSITNRFGSLRDAADYLEAIDSFERATGEMALSDDGARTYYRCLQLARIFSCLDGIEMDEQYSGDDLASSLERIRAFYPGVKTASACREAVRAEIVGHMKELLSDSKISRSARLRFHLLAISPTTYERAYRGYGALVKGVRR